MLSAYFFATACGLTSDEIEIIKKLLANPIEIQAVMDVDLILGSYGLFDVATNQVASSLVQLERREDSIVRFSLTMTDLSIKQCQQALHLAGKLNRVDTAGLWGIQGPLQATIEGIIYGFRNSGDRDSRYFSEWEENLSLRCERDFLPQHSLIRKSRSEYVTDPRITSGIRTYRALLEDGDESTLANESQRQRIEHDVALRFYVSDSGEYRDRIRHWVVTTNDLLLRFDALIAKRTGEGYPACIDPLRLLEILRLWNPQNDVWARAIMSSMRLPFVHLEATGKLDQAAIQVLSALASNGSLDDFDEFGVSYLINDELSRMASRAMHSADHEVSSELASARMEIESARTEIAARQDELSARQEELAAYGKELQEREESAIRRRFAIRLFTFSGTVSIVLIALVTIVLKQHWSLFKYPLIVITAATCLGWVGAILIARFYVSSVTDPAAIFWRDRLRLWQSYVVTLILNLLIAIAATGIYERLK